MAYEDDEDLEGLLPPPNVRGALTQVAQGPQPGGQGLRMPGGEGGGGGALGREAPIEGALRRATVELDDAGTKVPPLSSNQEALNMFRQLATQWQPDIQQYRAAKERERAAQEQLMQAYDEVLSGRAPPNVRSQAVNQMLIAMGAPRPAADVTGLTTAMGPIGYQGAYDSAMKRHQEALLGKAKANVDLAGRDVKEYEHQFTQASSAAKTLATLERIQALGSKPAAMSDLEKTVRSMGLDPATPEGRKQMNRLNYLRHGTPEIKQTLAANPDMDPQSPDFAQKVATQQSLSSAGKEATIAAKESTIATQQARIAEMERKAAEQRRIEESRVAIGEPPPAERRVSPVVNPNLNPYRALGPADRVKHLEKETKEWEDELTSGQNSLNERINKAQMFSDESKRAKELLPQLSFGGVYAVPKVGDVVQAVAGGLSGPIAEFRATSNRIAPLLRQAGSGAMSDFDVKILQSSTIGLDKPMQTNESILNGYIAASDRIQSYRAEKEKYFMQNQTRQGFDAIWKRYTDENKLLSRDKGTGVVRLNAVPDFKSWATTKGLM